MVEDLTSTRGQPPRWTRDDFTYVSPDIRDPVQSTFDEQPGLVLAGGAQEGHLRKQGVDKDDIFLFFGLFRRVEEVSGRWQFVPRAPEQHVLFGWLQVGAIRREDGEDWQGGCYVARDELISNSTTTRRGYGVFEYLDERLVLTEPGADPSRWRLPLWFYPEPPKVPLTYHPPRLWRRDAWHAYVQRRGPGQEFVLDLQHYPEAWSWVSQIVGDWATDHKHVASGGRTGQQASGDDRRLRRETDVVLLDRAQPAFTGAGPGSVPRPGTSRLPPMFTSRAAAVWHLPGQRVGHPAGVQGLVQSGQQRLAHRDVPGEHHVAQEFLLDGGDPRLHSLELGLQHQGPPGLPLSLLMSALRGLGCAPRPVRE